MKKNKIVKNLLAAINDALADKTIKNKTRKYSKKIAFVISLIKTCNFLYQY